MFYNNISEPEIRIGNPINPKNFCDYNRNVKVLPDNVEIPSFDAGRLAAELAEIEVNFEEEKRGSVKTARMDFVQDKLREMGIRNDDTFYKDGYQPESFATYAPFISDFSKPVTLYVAPTNTIQMNRDNIGDRLSGIVMGLALAAQLKKSNEYRNVIVLFVNQYNPKEASLLIEDLIQTKVFKTSVSEVIELGYFVGKAPMVESDFDSAGYHLFDEPINKAGLYDPGVGSFWGLHKYMNDLRYDAAIYESFATQDEQGKMTEEDEDEIFSVNYQVNFCSSNDFKTLYRILYQQAVIVSSYYYYNELDNNFKH